MKTAFKISAIIAILFGLTWYFFIKKDDYIVSFKVKTIPSVVYNSINNWEETVNRVTKQKITLLNEVFNNSITQKIIHKDSTYILNWKLKPINDSITDVTVGVSEVNTSLKNRLLIIIDKAPIKQYALNTISLFAYGLQNHLDKYKVKINGETISKSAYCACQSITTTQKNKANMMISVNAQIMPFLTENKIKFLGTPMLQLTNWDPKTEKISYDFCFPIEKSSNLPKLKGVFYKEIKPFESVKATYNGNYRTSDRAWYQLINYAEKNGIKHSNDMLEVFYNDPQQGGDQLKWKAEIFMPILK